MSSSTGVVRFSDGLIRYFLYNGITDLCRPRLFSTARKAWSYQGNYWNRCDCEDAEVAELFIDYGDGSHWAGAACRRCRCLVAGINPNPDAGGVKVHEGRPAWLSEEMLPPKVTQ